MGTFSLSCNVAGSIYFPRAPVFHGVRIFPQQKKRYRNIYSAKGKTVIATVFSDGGRYAFGTVFSISAQKRRL